MYYKENNTKVPATSFKEGFAFGYDIMPNGNGVWKWWLLGILIVITVILIIMWMIRKGRGKNSVGYQFY